MSSGFEAATVVALLISCNDNEELYQLTIKLRKLLSLEQNPPIQETIDAGGVPKLIELCQR